MLGGLALKNAFTRRYQKEEFELLMPEVQAKLKTYFSAAEPTKYYRTKDSFGDADFLCLWDDKIDANKVKDFIQETFNPKEIFRNTTVFSFDYKDRPYTEAEQLLILNQQVLEMQNVINILLGL